MIDRPGFAVRAGLAEADEWHCGPWQARVETLLSRLRAEAPSGTVPRPLRIDIDQAPPPHAGFGSGTQLAMALARICSIFGGESELPPQELARRAGRGRRSAVGLYGFHLGGLLVEAGKSEPDEISPLVARADFPADWRFVLVRPRRARGIFGTEESGAFARLPAMPEPLTDRLCRIVLLEMLPALKEHEFTAASEAIGRFGRLVGEYFAPVQGGIFADAQMRQLAGRLEARKIHGVGQTSWGPTLFILCPSAAFAENLTGELASELAAEDCELTVAAPRNHGAAIECQEL